MGACSYVYVRLIKKQPIAVRRETPKLIAAVFETGGQFAYVFALSANAIAAAPVISAYCMNDIILELASGKIQGAFVETVVAQNYIQNYPSLQIAWDVPYDSAGSAACVAKGNTALKDAANAVIAQVTANGSMRRINSITSWLWSAAMFTVE